MKPPMEMNELKTNDRKEDERGWYLVVLNQRPYAVLEAETEILSFLKYANFPTTRCKGKQYDLPHLTISVDAFGQKTLMEKPKEYVPATRSWSPRD